MILFADNKAWSDCADVQADYGIFLSPYAQRHFFLMV